jgi:hypothetical protein
MAKKPQRVTRSPRKAPARTARKASPAAAPELGRPSKFTQPVRQRIIDAAAAGNYLETCAAYGGIHRDTLNEWLRRGEAIQATLPGEDDRRVAAVEALSPIEREFSDFSDAIKEARARAEMRALLEITQAGRGRAGRTVRTDAGETITISEQDPIWQANAWYLERSHPERWGRKVIQKEISGPGGKPIQVEDVSSVSDEERLKRIQKLLGAQVAG